MAIRFTRSAHRHGVSEDRALYVIAHCPSPAYSPDDARERDFIIFLWADRAGVPLEVVAIEFENGDLLVIHAMKMHRQYLLDYARMLEWHTR